MHAAIKGEPNRVVLRIEGSLTFEDNKEWRTVVLDALDRDASEHVLDLTGLEDIDSAGLGMMLAMKKWAQDKGRSITLKFDPDSTAGSMLKLSKFDDMFTIKN